MAIHTFSQKDARKMIPLDKSHSLRLQILWRFMHTAHDNENGRDVLRIPVRVRACGSDNRIRTAPRPLTTPQERRHTDISCTTHQVAEIPGSGRFIPGSGRFAGMTSMYWPARARVQACTSIQPRTSKMLSQSSRARVQPHHQVYCGSSLNSSKTSNRKIKHSIAGFSSAFGVLHEARST